MERHRCQTTPLATIGILLGVGAYGIVLLMALTPSAREKQMSARIDSLEARIADIERRKPTTPPPEGE